MKQLGVKNKIIYKNFIIIFFSFITFYSLFRWIFDYKLNMIFLKEDLLTFWLPFILPLILTTIFLRKRVRILKFRKKNSDGNFLYLLIASFFIFLPTMFVQDYIRELNSKLVEVSSVYEIQQARSINCYKIKKFHIIQDKPKIYRNSRTTGKHNETLCFTNYIVAPIVDTSYPYDSKNHKYWYGIKFTKRMSNSASNKKKEETWNEFYKESLNKYASYDFNNYKYLQGICHSDDKDFYIRAAKLADNNQRKENLVILKPENKEFEERFGNGLLWSILSFGAGALLFFIMLLYPSVNKKELKNFNKKISPKDDDVKFILKLFIPRGEHFISSLLMDINLIIFVALVLQGLNVLSPSTHELIELGGNRRYEIMNGETWRLVSSMFLHSGFSHLFYNIIGIGITCVVIESMIGRWKTLLVYFLSGVGASITSIIWHKNSVSVGASGAIFGMMGFMISLLITKKHAGAKNVFYLILCFLGGITLLLGFFTNSDNAAHLGGLFSGIIVGLLLIIIDIKTFNKLNSKRKQK